MIVLYAEMVVQMAVESKSTIMPFQNTRKLAINCFYIVACKNISANEKLGCLFFQFGDIFADSLLGLELGVIKYTVGDKQIRSVGLQRQSDLILVLADVGSRFKDVLKCPNFLVQR
jgi:hypothetical protein